MNRSIAGLIAPQLPLLRRFARALTGSQDRGDAYAAATLEAIIADPCLFRRDLPPRPALYQAFLHVWNTLPFNRYDPRPGIAYEAAADRRIEMMTPRPRLAFLLAAVEEFSKPEISLIMQVSEAEVERLTSAAAREISQQLAARVLIIEDEPLIALDIETLVTSIGHEAAGIATTRGEARMLARRVRPGIVLADIQLADGSSGIDAVNDILEEIRVPVVFVTAYPKRFLTGKRAEPAFLVTKPFRPDMLKAVISQALFFDVKASAHRGAAA
jgi:DNA-directed RNA polymerase specialized sigma24 family protein